MSDTLLVLIGFLIGAFVTLGWVFWEFDRIKIAPFDNKDFEDWNGR